MLKTQTLVLEPLRNELNIKDSRAFTILSQESCFPFTVGLSIYLLTHQYYKVLEEIKKYEVGQFTL